MAYPINEDEFVDICMKELGEYDDVDEKIAHAVAVTLNWNFCRSQESDGQKE